jgi:hypothetical protein
MVYAEFGGYYELWNSLFYGESRGYFGRLGLMPVDLIGGGRAALSPCLGFECWRVEQYGVVAFFADHE